MSRYIRGQDRNQARLPPPCVEDYVVAEASVRFIDAYVERLDLEAVVERSRDRASQSKETIRRRGAIVEPPFGTLQNWGNGSFSVTTLEKVRGEFSLMCLIYNLRRALNILGARALIEALRRAPKIIVNRPKRRQPNKLGAIGATRASHKTPAQFVTALLSAPQRPKPSESQAEGPFSHSLPRGDICSDRVASRSESG